MQRKFVISWVHRMFEVRAVCFISVPCNTTRYKKSQRVFLKTMQDNNINIHEIWYFILHLSKHWIYALPRKRSDLPTKSSLIEHVNSQKFKQRFCSDGKSLHQHSLPSRNLRMKLIAACPSLPVHLASCRAYSNVRDLQLSDKPYFCSWDHH